MHTPTTIGIITEYNPFQQGHLLQIQTLRQLYPHARLVAVMSGSAMQRGELALLDKWTRASLAVQGGIDLVLELPTIYSCRSGEAFARGGVATLAALGCITHLAFGAETPDLELLQRLARVELSSAALRPFLAQGLSYAAAVTKLLATEEPAATTVLAGSNNILALEYLRALRALASSIQPLPLPRTGSSYNELHLDPTYASAGAIRRHYYTKGATAELAQVLPPYVFAALQEAQLPAQSQVEARLTLLLQYRLAQLQPQELSHYCECSEGLEHALLAALPLTSYRELVAALTSKRYSATRIQRLLLQLLLSSPTLSFPATKDLAPSYLRPLAFNSQGQVLLRELRSCATLPVLIKLGRQALNSPATSPALAQALAFDIAATDLRELLHATGLYKRDYLESPRILP